MLQIDKIDCSYDGLKAITGVEFTIEEGEFVGILGPNGSGKTTLLRAMSGVKAPDCGQVRLGGRDLRSLSPREIAQHIAYVSQDVTIELEFTVEEVVLMGRTPHLSAVGWESKHDLKVARHAMELAEVTHLAARRITELSGGERQRAMIAMALAQEADIMLLDEPTSHLDIAHQLAVLDLFKQLRSDHGRTVVAVFHDLSLAGEYCRRLILLDKGKVVAIGSTEEVLTTETLEQVYHMPVLVQKNPISGRPMVVLASRR